MTDLMTDTLADTMTDTTDETTAQDRTRRNTVLYLLCVVAACAALVLAFVVHQRSDDGLLASTRDAVGVDSAVGDATTKEDRSGVDLHAAVIRAATDEVLAFTNVDHQDLDKSVDAVKAGATGEFRKQYETSLDSLRRLMTTNQSVMTGEILSAGVVAADQDNATVLVATKGTVRNTQTKGKETERNLRLQVELRYVEGEWLTRDLQFVG